GQALRAELREGVRAGADRLLVRELGRVATGGVGRLLHYEGLTGDVEDVLELRHGEGDGDLVGAVDLRVVDRQARAVGRGRVLHDLERVGHVVSGQRRAVAELDAVAQGEGDLRAVGVPREV